MLNGLTGTIGNRGAYFPFSFADRSNLFAGEAIDTTVHALGQNDFGTLGTGLIAGTLVATDLGWQPVQDLRAGDRVVTFDNGMQVLHSVRVSSLWTAQAEAPRKLWPMQVPARALGNRTEMRLMPEQAVLIESDQAEELYGDPFLLVSAGTLEGYKGITRVPPQREVTVVTLQFQGDEVVYVNGTLLAHCPAPRIETVRSAEEMMMTGSDSLYQRLTDPQARRLVAAMQ
jgi:hypothetical protein